MLGSCSRAMRLLLSNKCPFKLNGHTTENFTLQKQPTESFEPHIRYKKISYHVIRMFLK